MPDVVAAVPFLKWAGGKRQLLDDLDALVPETFAGYHEPFLGGGALFFHLLPRITDRVVVLGDVNEDLMAAYSALKMCPEEVIQGLRQCQEYHSEYHYLAMRAQDSSDLSLVERAIRFIYLNRSCFNGLWRENAKGQMNVPLGDTPAERLFDFENLRAAHLSLRHSVLAVGPYYQLQLPSVEDWFVYMDPPYHGVFSQYTRHGFDDEDHRQLAEHAASLAARGAKVLISNSDTPYVRELYRDWIIESVSARRAISGKRHGRSRTDELLIRNY